MKLKELRETEQKVLQDRLAELREKERSIKFGLGNREVKNIREVRGVKREIAHILTVISERRHAGTEKATKE
ncbi:MAG: 50S ribosomal protein L29 [Candidatus Komeilibacteria bacterium]|nr:50S ribosomal protein L29 [Candidatus Komeilibacteria bacterium]